MTSRPEKHPPGETLWRYMDLPKLLWMLEVESLYFSTLAQLRADDPYEGFVPPPLSRDHVPENLRSAIDDANARYVNQNIEFAVNCWHQNDYESAAMWALYDRAGAGIAIRTTRDRLEESLRPYGRIVRSDMVKYVDYDASTLTMSVEATVTPLLKRRSYAHEREFRLWVQSSEPQRIGVNLDHLVESVVVAPTADHWVPDVIAGLFGRYGLGRGRVEPSRLWEKPPTIPTKAG